MTETERRIREALSERFTPQVLDVVNDSARHAGHAGAGDGGGGTHFNVRIVSDAFAGMSRVERHRAVNAAVADAFDAGLHAFSIVAQTPEEAG